MMQRFARNALYAAVLAAAATMAHAQSGTSSSSNSGVTPDTTGNRVSIGNPPLDKPHEPMVTNGTTAGARGGGGDGPGSGSSGAAGSSSGSGSSGSGSGSSGSGSGSSGSGSGSAGSGSSSS